MDQRPDKIFISYRREDSADICGRIYDRLVARYGRTRVFKDVDSIPLGVNFGDYIARAVGQCAVQLVLIGPRWLSARGPHGRRLDDPADFVRIEIETALARRIPIIPLLVQGTHFPPPRKLPPSLRPLVEQNGIAVRPDPDFERDMERVLAAVDHWLAAPPRAPAAPQDAPAPAVPAVPAAPAPALGPAVPAVSQQIPATTNSPQDAVPAAPPPTAAPSAPERASPRPAPIKPSRRPRLARTAVPLAAALLLLVATVGVLALSSKVFPPQGQKTSTLAPLHKTQTAVYETWDANTRIAAAPPQAYSVAAPDPCNQNSPVWVTDPNSDQNAVPCPQGSHGLEVHGAQALLRFTPPWPTAWKPYEQHPYFTLSLKVTQLAQNECGKIVLYRTDGTQNVLISTFTACGDGTCTAGAGSTNAPCGPCSQSATHMLQVQVKKVGSVTGEWFYIDGNTTAAAALPDPTDSTGTTYYPDGLEVGLVPNMAIGTTGTNDHVYGVLNDFSFEPLP